MQWLTAVQSQDYFAAKWALGQRTQAATEADLDRLFDEGGILRTHVLRPTWHFVLPDDIRWLLELTGPRIRRGLAARYRRLGIDEDVAARGIRAITGALAGGRHLTRPELGEVLSAEGILIEGQRLPHLLMGAELDALITSGPRRGNQFTYALLEERAPNARRLDRPEAIAELTQRYLRSHGPAQLQDLAWWSGLTLAEARGGVALAGPVLDRQVVDGKEYWFDSEPGPAVQPESAAHLLPNFDEYTVAYRDRSATVDPDVPFDSAFFPFGSVISNVVIVGGRVRGSWRRTKTREGVRVDVRPLDRFQPIEAAAVVRAGQRLAQYLESGVEVQFSADRSPMSADG